MSATDVEVWGLLFRACWQGKWIILADAAMFIFTFRDHFHTPALEGVLLAILEHKAKFLNFLYPESQLGMSLVVRMEIWLVIPKTFCLLKPLRNYILIVCSWFFSLFIASSSINTHIQVMTFVERNNTSFMNVEDIEEIFFFSSVELFNFDLVYVGWKEELLLLY